NYFQPLFSIGYRNISVRIPLKSSALQAKAEKSWKIFSYILILINEHLKNTEKNRYRQPALCLSYGNSFCSIFHERAKHIPFPYLCTYFHHLFQWLSVY